MIYKSNKLEVYVIKNDLELNNIYRNEDVMRNASIKSGGNYFDIEEYKKINFTKITDKDIYRYKKILRYNKLKVA